MHRCDETALIKILLFFNFFQIFNRRLHSIQQRKKALPISFFFKASQKISEFSNSDKIRGSSSTSFEQLLDLQKETSWRQRNCLYIIPFSFSLYNIHKILVIYPISHSHCIITLFAIATLGISIWPLPTSYLGLL